MRDAYIHVADGVAAGRPLAFLFHGTGGDEHQFLRPAREILPEAGLIAPRGDVSEMGHARFFRRQAEGVYDMADLARATERMAGFVTAHRDAVRPSQVIGIGYSNGANILAAVMFARPELFDAAVLMHPLIPFDPPPAPVRGRVLITAGERDPICPPAGTRALDAWFRTQGTLVETLWHPGGHELRPVELDAARAFLAGARAA